MKDVGGKEGRGMEGGGREGGNRMSKYRWWRGWGEEQLTRPRMQFERLTHLGKVYTQCTLLRQLHILLCANVWPALASSVYPMGSTHALVSSSTSFQHAHCQARCYSCIQVHTASQPVQPPSFPLLLYRVIPPAVPLHVHPCLLAGIPICRQCLSPSANLSTGATTTNALPCALLAKRRSISVPPRSAMDTGTCRHARAHAGGNHVASVHHQVRWWSDGSRPWQVIRRLQAFMNGVRSCRGRSIHIPISAALQPPTLSCNPVHRSMRAPYLRHHSTVPGARLVFQGESYEAQSLR